MALRDRDDNDINLASIASRAYWLICCSLTEVRCAFRAWPNGLALAVRPAGSAEAPALKGGS